MEELFELKNHIEQGRYEDALALTGEMEEMSRDDKINKIESYMATWKQINLPSFLSFGPYERKSSAFLAELFISKSLWKYCLSI